MLSGRSSDRRSCSPTSSGALIEIVSRLSFQQMLPPPCAGRERRGKEDQPVDRREHHRQQREDRADPHRIGTHMTERDLPAAANDVLGRFRASPPLNPYFPPGSIRLRSCLFVTVSEFVFVSLSLSPLSFSFFVQSGPIQYGLRTVQSVSLAILFSSRARDGVLRPGPCARLASSRALSPRPPLGLS